MFTKFSNNWSHTKKVSDWLLKLYISENSMLSFIGVFLFLFLDFRFCTQHTNKKFDAKRYKSYKRC